MYALGIHMAGESVLLALLHKLKNKIEVVHTQKLPFDVKLLDTLAPILEGKNVKIVTGLAADEVIRRDVTLQLKSEKKILQALPFQMETLIPYPESDAIVVPFLYPQADGSTHVILIAAQKKHLQTHLETLPMDCDIVSSVPTALMRFCQFSYPDQNCIALISQNSGICVQREKLLLAQVLDPERLKAYIGQKFPDAFFVPDEEFAIPIGLALEGLHKTPTQFRVEEFAAQKEIKREKLFLKSFVAACAFLFLATISIQSLTLGQKEKALKAEIDTFCGQSSDPLEERIEKWEKTLSSFKKPSTQTPKVSDILAWLSSKKNDIDVIRLHYTANPPRVELEFTAPSPTIARSFHEELLKGDPLIDPRDGVDWKVSQDRYRISFGLRKQR